MSLNVVDNEGVTPLHVAVTQGHDKVAMLLANCGADVNVEDKEGITPYLFPWGSFIFPQYSLSQFSTLAWPTGAITYGALKFKGIRWSQRKLNDIFFLLRPRGGIRGMSFQVTLGNKGNFCFPVCRFFNSSNIELNLFFSQATRQSWSHVLKEWVKSLHCCCVKEARWE